ncbi:hypothetical protein J0A68_10560 [Algoriphagus sp. H41]|uniref:PH domain-containing protein n=1 Tax=Algoriphagus oliviformis TaxID=2811231 RepID=A0ABS3C2T8_9BACT|nr:hypothetical protein [Algoriphagus oliviformis]MBN7811401.1 hypothetical protein [Algoriphagus oliviformis]
MHGRIFKEEQTYRGTWVFYAVIMLEIPTLVLVSVLTLTSKTERQEALLALVIVASIMALAVALLTNIKLETRIDDKGIHFKYFPFVRWRLIERSQIKNATIITFNPLMDHGGWGIKGNRETKAYTILGDTGLLVDGGEKKKVLIGTQKPKELSDFIENWMED